MADVLRHADAEHPEEVTQRVYDETRVAVGYGSHSRADRLAARFKLSWAELRRRALQSADPASTMERSLVGKTRARRVVTQAECIAAVRQVAARRGSEELTAAEYNETRTAMNAEAARRHLHGQHIVGLPSAEQIRVSCQSFAFAAQEAGVTVSKLPPRTMLPRVEAIVAFVEHFGFRPRRADLQWLGRHHGIQFVMANKDHHGTAVAAARERFQRLGRWFPPQAKVRDRPEGWEQLGEGSTALAELAQRYPRLRTASEAFTPEEIRQAIATAYDALAPGQTLTAARYRGMYRRLGLPSVKTIYFAAADNSQTFRALVVAETRRRGRNARTRARE